MDRIFIRLVIFSAAVPCAMCAVAEEFDPEAIAFFESRIRPVLIDHCYKCHGADPEKIKGDLNLTYRDAMRNREGGAVVVPGDPGASKLLEAIRYENPDLQMPPSGKLGDVIADDIAAWIEMGAPDPREKPSETSAVTQEASWKATLERRKQWWSYQPVRDVIPPQAQGEWARNPIDAFIKHAIDDAGVETAPVADAYTLIRRLSFVLTGLPPSRDEVDAFVQAASSDFQGAVESATDRMLASPRFGERWARHLMDWLRYAESHGSEGDPRIPYAWRYRDYLIRALNNDVPYDRLVHEHIAGDRMPNPRVNDELGINESAIGAAQYRMTLHGFGPTDALQEQVRFTDNQIDVVSKAFLAATVSCARCHDHKFDPISQEDYYALYGTLISCRPASITVDTPENQSLYEDDLIAAKQQLKEALADRWLQDIESIEDRLSNPNASTKNAIANATTPIEPLHPWQRLNGAAGSAFERGWRDLVARWNASLEAIKRRAEIAYPVEWRFGEGDGDDWVRHGNGLSEGVSPAGSFAIEASGNTIVTGIYPKGVYSHLLSAKHSGIISSPRYLMKDRYLYVRAAGTRNAVARYVIQNYPRDGTIYPVGRMSSGTIGWRRWDMEYWNGDMAYVEISTAMDQAVVTDTGATHSWFGVTDVVMVAEGQPLPSDEMAEFTQPFYTVDMQSRNRGELAERYKRSLRACVEAWRGGEMTDEQARYLDYFVRNGVLTNATGASDTVDAKLNDFRAIENKVPVPTRVPGAVEHEPIDQPLFAQGDHKKPEDTVPRRFLEAINPEPFNDVDAGRLELAHRMTSDENPLAARVIVNRIWHHVFGQGIVRTTDDFGAMGEQPSHPELLDYLATRMRSDDWSIKEMIRSMVTSRTFQSSSAAPKETQDRDPNNRLFARAEIRRLEAEAIRDSMLQVAGRLNLEAPSGSVNGDSDRRSVYVRVIRNQLDPFLHTFDAPEAVSTKGRRNQTNVPAHALTMMNDPFVRSLADVFADRFVADQTLSDDQRSAAMFEEALGRPPSDGEKQIMTEFLAAAQNRPAGIDQAPTLAASLESLNDDIESLKNEMQDRVNKAIEDDPAIAELKPDEQTRKVNPNQQQQLRVLDARLAYLNRIASPPQPWHELAHSLFNAKEFIYLR